MSKSSRIRALNIVALVAALIGVAYSRDLSACGVPT